MKPGAEQVVEELGGVVAEEEPALGREQLAVEVRVGHERQEALEVAIRDVGDVERDQGDDHDQAAAAPPALLEDADERRPEATSPFSREWRQERGTRSSTRKIAGDDADQGKRRADVAGVGVAERQALDDGDDQHERCRERGDHDRREPRTADVVVGGVRGGHRRRLL